MSFELVDRQTTTTTTHRSHTHVIHRSNTLLVTHLLSATPQFAACYADTTINGAASATGTITTTTAAAQDSSNECSADEASHELLDYYINDPTADSGSAPDTIGFDPAFFKLDTLDFSLTKRLLGAVFFLLVIYAWKQYIDEEESDFIYI